MSDLSYAQAVAIGALQGVTELFPVSSLGHSVLVPAWIGGGWRHLVTEQSTSASESSPYLAFIVAVHCATALALIVHYRATWTRLLTGLATSLRDRSVRNNDQRVIWLVVLATIPAGVLGVALEHKLRVLFAKPAAAAAFLVGNGVILLAGERLRRRPLHQVGDRAEPSRVDVQAVASRVTLRDAALIGVAQSSALLAGISRAGVTMVAGLWRGLDHESAADFAFLLATPIILAAGVLKLPDLAAPAAAGIRGPTLLGALVAAVAAYVSVRFLTRYFERLTLWPFAVYCLVFGTASLLRFG